MNATLIRGTDVDAPVRVRRVVTVTRPTDYELLIDRHATRGQVEFVLASRGGTLEDIDGRHAAHVDARHRTRSAIPVSWRRAHVDRADLDRFLFEPDDIIVAIGQDGLVPNVAKYLDGQPVIGVNPEVDRFPGRLVTVAPADVARVLALTDDDRQTTSEVVIRTLTMVEGVLDDGRRLRALNEIFVGHRSHQSARYTLRVDDREESQSSSGLIVATGTGATGWATSIHRATACNLPLPEPNDPALILLVREAWPSVTTGAELVAALVSSGHEVQVTSAMDDGGTVFGDGIESDPLPFDLGRSLRIHVADTHLNLVTTPN